MTPNAIRKPSRLGVTLCILVGVMTPPPLPAQTPDVPVLVIEEPTPKLTADRIRASAPSELAWSEARELLMEQDLPAPARPSQFSLTPRDPYRMPGGFIALSGSGNGQVGSSWQPLGPDPTGAARMDDDNAIYVLLRRLKPEYKYAVDLSLSSSGGAARLEVETCTLTAIWRMNTLVDGSQHVLIVAGTDRDGEACFQLKSTADSRMYLYSATISELGPSRRTRGPLAPGG